ncbi:MAG TPA: hypothetical protein P5539_05770 [Mesotoga sp.]|nr:hypothetical protein [Mesotoga sp.]
MALSTLEHLSTSTPASNVSREQFERGDDGRNSEELAVPNFDDILRNSPAAKLIGLKGEDDEGSLPKNGEDVPTPEDEADEDPDAASEAENEADENAEDESAEEETSEDDASTQAELPTEEDIDWEYKIPVPVNGKVEYKTLAEVRKGFATDQHLSQKGREIGELKKQVEEERTAKLNELVQLGTVLHEEISAQEKTLESEYVTITEAIKKARADGDTYTARELKEKQEEIQEQYWSLRNKRESRTKEVVAQLQAKQAEEQQRMVEQFSKDIKDVLPEFNDQLAKSIRKFALDEGIPEGLLDLVYDAKVVKFIDDYRRLKTAKDVGAAKRKAVPSAKSVPTRKGAAPAARQAAAQQQSRQRVLSGEAGEREQMDFLKSISSVSRKL